MNVNEKLLRKDRKILFSFLVSIVVSLVLTIYNAVFGIVNFQRVRRNLLLDFTRYQNDHIH